MKRITVIGGGASGTMLGVSLLKNAGDERLEVNLVDKRDTTGRGVAYSTPEDVHLWNVPAAKMGAFPDDMEHFDRWLGQRGHGFAPTAFVPRRIFGEYLRSRLNDADECKNSSATLKVFDDEAVDVKLGGSKAYLR